MLALVVAFVCTRVIYWAVGVRFDAQSISGKPGSGLYQILDLRLLHEHLLPSIVNLHSQPPLFNLYLGLVLKLPSSLREPAAWTTYLALGLVLVLATYLLLNELGATTQLSFGVALLIATCPTYVLYENWLFYAYPTAVLVTVSGLLCARFLRRRHWLDGLAFFSSTTALALLNSTFQAVWIVPVAILVLSVVRIGLTRTGIICLSPIIVLAGWLIKDNVMFGTVTTSSWLGMNLSDQTLVPAARDHKLLALVHQGTLDAFALLPPFQPVAGYSSSNALKATDSGVPALDEATKSDGSPNYNNAIYLKVSSRLLSNDLRYMRAEPWQYIRNSSLGASVWFTPADQYAYLGYNRSQIQGFANVIDGIIGLQVHEGDGKTFHTDVANGHHPALPQISMGMVLVYVFAILGIPSTLWRRRHRRRREVSGTLVYLWLTVVYAFAVTSLSDSGENNRFRFELGTVPLILAVFAGLSALRWLTELGVGAVPSGGAHFASRRRAIPSRVPARIT
ncbi:MAG: hypothetical protein M3063_01845 [Actinomycetota bacterium]|nr:hypothetical protein [Actinomycetota bacterium]